MFADIFIFFQANPISPPFRLRYRIELFLAVVVSVLPLELNRGDSWSVSHSQTLAKKKSQICLEDRGCNHPRNAKNNLSSHAKPIRKEMLIYSAKVPEEVAEVTPVSLTVGALLMVG